MLCTAAKERVVVLVLIVDEVLNLGDLDVGHLSSRKCRNSASLLLEGGAKSYAKNFAWWVFGKAKCPSRSFEPTLEPALSLSC